MTIDFEKSGGLVPAIIQDANTQNVLMLGYMNKEAYDKTMATKKVTSGVARATVSGRRARPAGISLTSSVWPLTAIMTHYS